MPTKWLIYVAQAAVGRGDWYAPHVAEVRASAWDVDAFGRELDAWAANPPAE